MKQTLTLSADTTAVEAALSSLSKALQAHPEVADRFVHLLEPFEELVSFETDLTATALTGELVVCLNPSDRLLSLVTAVRTGNS